RARSFPAAAVATIWMGRDSPASAPRRIARMVVYGLVRGARTGGKSREPRVQLGTSTANSCRPTGASGVPGSCAHRRHGRLVPTTRVCDQQTPRREKLHGKVYIATRTAIPSSSTATETHSQAAGPDVRPCPEEVPHEGDGRPHRSGGAGRRGP